jgi:Tfp pilus assembly protein PilF
MREVLAGLVLLFLIAACSSWPKIYKFHDPLTPQEHLMLGVSYESRGETNLAIAEYQKVIAVAPEREGVTARVFLGNLYAGLEQFQMAERYYREALSLEPRRRQALNNLASIYVTQGIKLDEAEQLARAALAEAKPGTHDRQEHVYLETLGEVLLRQGRYKEALENFEKAETLTENGKALWLVHLYTNMAHAYKGLGRMDEAREAERRAEELRRSAGP